MTPWAWAAMFVALAAWVFKIVAGFVADRDPHAAGPRKVETVAAAVAAVASLVALGVMFGGALA